MMSIPPGAKPAAARLPIIPPVVFWKLSTPQPASINTSLSPVLTRMVLICRPTGLDGWNVDVSRASCVLGPIAPQRFGRERERAVADDGDLDGAELEAVEARLRPLARLGRISQGGDGGGECSGPDGGRAGTQEHPAVEHEHVCSPFRVALSCVI